MGIFEHKSKIVTVTNLPEAYKEVAKLESAKKQTENQKAFKRVQEFKKSGVKPEGWRKNTDDKLLPRIMSIHWYGSLIQPQNHPGRGFSGILSAPGPFRMAWQIM